MPCCMPAAPPSLPSPSPPPPSPPPPPLLPSPSTPHPPPLRSVMRMRMHASLPSGHPCSLPLLLLPQVSVPSGLPWLPRLPLHSLDPPPAVPPTPTPPLPPPPAQSRLWRARQGLCRRRAANQHRRRISHSHKQNSGSALRLCTIDAATRHLGGIFGHRTVCLHADQSWLCVASKKQSSASHSSASRGNLESCTKCLKCTSSR